MLLLLATACAVEVEVEAASGTWDSKLSPKKRAHKHRMIGKKMTKAKAATKISSH